MSRRFFLVILIDTVRLIQDEKGTSQRLEFDTFSGLYAGTGNLRLFLRSPIDGYNTTAPSAYTVEGQLSQNRDAVVVPDIYVCWRHA